jgi:hypothetical protein
MFLWSENYGGRGSTEITSCIYQYLTTQCNPGNKKKLIVWSDNCGGQNKNQYMMAMYLVLIATQKEIIGVDLTKLFCCCISTKFLVNLTN